MKDLQKLEQLARSPTGDGLARLRSLLGATQAHITEHFRFEEQDGYMDAVRKREPRLERTVQQLAEEHRHLGQALDTLIRKAGAASDVDSALQEGIQAWIERVRRHEIRENDLVQAAFNMDINAED
jgi:hypothetical protein